MRQSDNHFQVLIENASDAIVIVNTDATILYENPTMERMTGRNREERIGRNAVEFCHPDDIREVADIFGPLFENTTFETSAKLRLQHKNGEWRELEVFGINLVDNKAVEGIVFYLHDITERMRAEEALRESREKLRIIFDSIGDGITVVDLEGNIVDVNETVLRMKGYSREDVIGRYGLDFVAERDRTRATDAMMNHFNGQSERSPFAEYALLTGNGSEVPCEASASLLRDISGNITGIICIERDITERKKAEQALRESEELYRLLAENVTDVIWVRDLNMKLSYISPSVERARGWSVEEAMALKLVEAVTPASLERITRVLAEEMARENQEQNDPHKSRTMEVELYCKDGSTLWTEMQMTFLRDKDGEINGILGVSRDITRRKKAEEELKRYSDRLREIAVKLTEAQEKERQRLAQDLHDTVGQYVTALSINLGRAFTQLPGEEGTAVRSILDDSQSIVEQMSDTIRNLTDKLRPPVIEDYGLVAALRWYADRFTDRTGIAVTVQGKEPRPRLDSSHESALFRIAQEVLTNVAKHAQANHVSVNIAPDSGKVRLVITDDGIGFDTADVTVSGGQYGWGLIMMSEHARDMGGSFNVESSPGHGTRVIVEIGR